jgi:hypothetical protein
MQPAIAHDWLQYQIQRSHITVGVVAGKSEAMAEMKAMEFTDELKLQPVRRPVPEPQAGEILIQVSAAGVNPYREALVSHQPLCGRYSPIQGNSRT